ncbi:phosphodiesterase [Carboxydothermus ferrireducens]|uniref:Phosphoesterase n=1 Tax=Carboxydothermus ferrireducens DSM 11255 TaxID=1119529 RepID=A0ABX2REF9_9THEO|nr:phosphodiesterase [Carboxydothermus ferrireducens]NYE58240.1 hypothetical protein [Carboxydothermus ferrireducens DSM 11255]
MAIGVISDIHGSLQRFIKAYDFLKDTEFILCAGDVLYHGPRNPLPEGYDPAGLAKYLKSIKQKIYIARGNCDAEVDETFLGIPFFSPFFLTEYRGKKLMVVHDFEKLKENYLELADIVIHGHSHVWQIEKFSNCILLNPGSPSLPKGFKPVPTIAIIDRDIKIIDIVTGNIVKTVGDLRKE